MSNTVWVVAGVFVALIVAIFILKAVRAKQESMDEDESEELEAAASMSAKRQSRGIGRRSCFQHRRSHGQGRDWTSHRFY